MGIAQKIARTVTLAVLSFFAMPVTAVTVPGLYSIEVPVESSGSGDLAKGYADGLSRVFVRVSGSRDVLLHEGVQALLDDAESLLQSYQYLRSEEDGNRLQMAFGAVGVNKALASVNAPVWGANRPLVLAWIAIQSGGSRTLLHKADDPQTESPWREAFMAAAQDRGLPVSLPPATFADRRELMSDIWGQFTSNVRAASEELSYDLISLVRVSRSGDEWRAGWVFDGMELVGAEQSVTASDPQALATAVIGEWADTFASRYAVDGSKVGESPQVDIIVHGVGGFEDYAGVNRALENLSPVESADPTRTENERVTLRVTFSGEIEQLKGYIALDPRLIPLSEAEVSRLPATQDEDKGATDANNAEPSSNPLYAYDALPTGEEESEQAFESLYQVLHYRWQPASVITGESNE